jgi:hypothetical protein
MRSALRVSAAIALAASLGAVGCAPRDEAPAQPREGPPPEVVERLKAPDDPERIIYHPPPDLARRPAGP